jgi:hypothetical protein
MSTTRANKRASVPEEQTSNNNKRPLRITKLTDKPTTEIMQENKEVSVHKCDETQVVITVPHDPHGHDDDTVDAINEMLQSTDPEERKAALSEVSENLTALTVVAQGMYPLLRLQNC